MDGWTIPVKSFDAVTLLPFSGSYQNGSPVDLDEVMTGHACQVIATGTSTGDQAQILLQGSLDGINWYTLGSGGAPPAPSPGATGTVLLSGTGAARYVRTVGYSSGSSVVTTWVTSG